MSSLFPRHLLAATLALSALTIGPASAADFAAFRDACLNGGPFLVGDVPGGKSGQPVLDALCPCLEAGFADYSQAEIDVLEADLRTVAPGEVKPTYPAYEELQDKATAVLGTCFASEEVMAAARAEGI